MNSEKYYTDLFNNALTGIYQSSTDGKFLHVNPAMARIMGYSSAKELIESIDNVQNIYVYKEQRQKLLAIIDSEGYAENFISQIYTQDNSVIWISEEAWTIRDESGTVIGFQGMVRNISPKRNLDERMAKKQKVANQNQKMEAIKTMARGISHDFNNILSPIVGYTEMLLEFNTHDEKTERYLQNILKSVNKASDLSARIHTLAQPANFKSQPVYLDEVMDDVMKKLTISMPPTINVDIDIAPDMHPVLMDENNMYYILMNLCTNAYMAMANKGGTLTVKIHQGELDGQFISEELLDLAPGEFIILHVNDSGVGIPPHALERIFDPYYSTQQKGKGLGLSLSYSLIKQHDGDIQIKSKENSGTNITCYLPTFDTMLDKKNSAKPSKHILLVDDDKDVLDIQKKMIEKLGYQVTAFIESPLALQTFKDSPESFDLILTDMNMPQMTGLDLSKSILSIDSQKPIILCTGFSDSVNESLVKRAGIKKFILKPLTTQKLANDLKSVFES